MKEISKKIIAIIFTMLMLVNSSFLTLISVAVEEIQNTEDTSKINAEVELDVEKYVNYDFEDKKGTLLKLNLSTGIKYDEDQEYKPIKSTVTELIAPQIKDEYPERIEVQAISTKATNGSDVAKDWNYEYEASTGKISISTLNNEVDGKIYSEKIDGARDTYKINLYYSSNCYDANNSENDLEITGKITEILDTKDSMQIKGDINKTIQVSENISGLISADIDINDIYNGNIYANINNGTNNATEYTELMNINVDYASISDEIEINEDDKFVNTDNVDVATEDIVYKSTKVNKNNILDILGEDGKLQILNSNNEILLEVNKNIQSQEDGMIKVDFVNEQSSLIVKTSKPIKQGTIKIENTKSIKATALDINNNKVKTETSVKAINNIKQENEIQKQEIYSFSNAYEKEIKESTTRIDLSVNKQEWTNNTVNDINFTLKLVSNDIKYNLFKKPVIEIKLPEDVDKVILDETSLVYNDSNFIENTELVENGTNKIIKITLNGVQNSYYTNAIYEGTYIIVPAKITLKGELTTLDSNIELTYSNENGKINDYELEGKTSKIINIKELDEKQEARLSAVRYNVSALSLEDTGNSANALNVEENVETIEGLTFSTVAQVGNKVLQDGDIVYEKQIITYTAKITNNSSSDIKNLSIIGKIPEGTTYVTVSKGIDDIEDMEKMYKYVGDTNVTEETITIDKIEKGSSIERVYEVEVNELDSNITEKNITSNTALYSNGRKIAEASINNIVKKSKIYARMVSTMGGFVNEDNKWEYCLLITNNTQDVLRDVDISVNIPKWMNVYETGSLTQDVEVSNETFENAFYKAKVSQLPVGKQVILRIYMEPKNLEKNVYMYPLEVAAEINAEGIETYNTNLNTQVMFTREIVVSMSSESEGKEVKYDDEIEYNVKVKVNGYSTKFENIDVNVLDYLPDELIPEEVEYEKIEYNEETKNYDVSTVTEDISSKVIEDENEKTSPDVNLYLTIPNGLEINIKIKARVNLISENKEVQNSVSVTTGEADTIISNIVKFTIIAGDPDNEEKDEDNPTVPDDGKDDEENKDNPDDSGEDNKEETDKSIYEINGQVWIDENKDGQKGEKEQKISGVTVKLFNMDTNTIVTDALGEKYITATNDEGKYKFSNLSKGKYLVIFEYDSNTYELTAYRKNGVSEEVNSDVIKKEISIDGRVEIAGVTDAVTIDTKSVENIDAGLVKGTVLDLKLDKYVSKITVANSKGTKDYDYKEQKLAKVEVAAKEIADTKITVTFKIVITNEGEQSAYISEITDYLPEGLTLEGVDGNWQMMNDGSIKIYGLSGLLLKPGASKEIEITTIATDMGKFVNSAEITLIKSDGNLKDKDSIEGNKDKTEDDYSEATVIISIKTGAIIGSSIGIILAIILIIIFTILYKKNNRFKKYIKLSVLLLIGTSILTVGITTSQAATVAEKKEELKKKYTSTEIIPISSGSSRFYTHDTPYNKVVNSTRLHCTDGKKAMCGVGTHKYKQTKVTVTKFDPKPTTTSANKYTANPNSSEGEKLNNSYNIYGPYKVTRTNDDKVTPDEVKSIVLYNIDGNKISSSKWSICDKSGNSKEFSFNHNFYIKVAKKSNPSKMEIKINNTITTSYTANYKVVEEWRCFEVSDGSHNGHGCYKVGNAQPLERVYENTESWTNSATKSKTITLKLTPPDIPPPPPDVETAGAKIKKIDDRNGTPLEGVGFSFSTTIMSYDLIYSQDIYHWVLEIVRWDIVWVPTLIGKNIVNVPHAVPVWGYVWRYWYTENYYAWQPHTVYLGNNRQWGYSEGIFYTNEDGIASGQGTLSLRTYAWNDGGLGNNHTEYAYFIGNTITATEKSIPSQYYGYNNNIGSSWYIQREGGTTVKAYNHQYEVMLSGFVWLDEHSGKLSMTDSEFNGEPGLNGIAVKLKDRYGNTIQTTYTSELGIYDEIYGGEYRFYNVSLDQIQYGNYHVEFEYCGIDYQAVNPELYNTEGSKATDRYSRNILDNKLSSVTGNGSQYLNVNGVSLNYNQNRQYQSTINSHYGCTVYASTQEAGYYLYSNFIPTSKEIRYVNLGLFKKEQTDYALAQDLYNVRVKVNGLQHVYRYANTRYQSYGEYTDENSAWNVGVKFQNNRGSYTRAIYKSDYEYESKEDASKNINVYVTYKVSLRNEGSYLGRINNIVDYCDSNYTLENVGYSINDEDKITDTIGFNEESSPYGGYRKYIINTSQRTIDDGEEQCLYIQFVMNKQAIFTIMNNGETKHNLVEINSYTTFDDTGKPIAVYDKDSVPGTARPENFNTYEDDTDSARSLQLEFRHERTVEGLVFVDKTGKEGKEAVIGEERIGDGIYQQNKDKTVKENQVKITLQEVDEQGNKKENGLVYTTYTDKDGKFKFSNFVPAYYQIIYTWGDKEYKVQYYKGTIYNDKARSEKTQKDLYWYRGKEYENDTIYVSDRRSDALDNDKIRKNIEEQMRSITNNTLTSLIENAYTPEGQEIIKPDGTKEKIITSMDSATPTMEFSVEYESVVTSGDDSDRVEFVVQNVDFGIVERSKQALEFTKKISGYKLTLANGQTIVDATIEYDEKTGKPELKGSYSHTTLMGPLVINGTDFFGILKTEMDNELIEGAKLDVTYTMKVTNVSEKDYSTDDYYYYGIANDNAKVTMSITELLDYVDGRLNNVDPNEQWQETDKKHLEDVNVSMKDNEDINKYRTYLTTKLEKPLATGESNEINLYTSKLLTSTDDNTFDNKSEISEVTKNDGFTAGTPVKLINNYFNIGNAQTVVIIPSTGENRDYVVPIIIGVTVVTILGIGIFLIKKFVVD